MESATAASHLLASPASASTHISPTSSSIPPISPSALPRQPIFWTDLFSKSQIDAPTTSLSIFHPSFIDGVAQVPTPIVESGIARWQEYLVGFVLGKRLPLFFIRQEIEKYLKCKESIELSGEKNSFLFKCKNPEHRKLLIDGGPIFIASRIMLIQEWSSAVEAKKDRLVTIPLWMNLEIPRELWHLDGISFTTSLFGEPLRMNEYTANMSKTKFASVCVTINTDFKFPASIPVNLGCRLDTVKAEYTWKPKICTSCRTFGHTNKDCDGLAAGPLGDNAVRTNPRNKRTQIWGVTQRQPDATLSTKYDEKRSTTTLSSATEPANCTSSVMVQNHSLHGQNSVSRREGDAAGIHSLQGQNSISRREGDAAGIHTSNRFSLLDAMQQQQDEIERCIPCHSDKGERNINDGRLAIVGMSLVGFTGTDPSSMGTHIFQTDIEGNVVTVSGSSIFREPTGTRNSGTLGTNHLVLEDEPNSVIPVAAIGSTEANEEVSAASIYMDVTNQIVTPECENFLSEINHCLDTCAVVVDSLRPPVCEKVSEKVSLVDKGPNIKPTNILTFDPSNPKTWPDSIKEADEEIALVMSRLRNPEPVMPKAKENDLKLKLVKGNSGEPIRSSSRNRR